MRELVQWLIEIRKYKFYSFKDWIPMKNAYCNLSSLTQPRFVNGYGWLQLGNEWSRAGNLGDTGNRNLAIWP